MMNKFDNVNKTFGNKYMSTSLCIIEINYLHVKGFFPKLSKIHGFHLKLCYSNPFSAGTAFMLMQTGWIQASRRVTRRLA